MYKHYPKEFNFVPVSYVLPGDIELLKNHMKSEKHTYIVKPSAGAEGCGIFLV